MIMKRRLLGNTDLKVTEIGLGTWPLGGTGQGMNYGRIDSRQARSVLEAYCNAGGNFIDTARGYNESERHIGLFLSSNKNRRENLIIATKSEGGQVLETIPQIEKDLETSLRSLKTDYVDILQLHQPPDDPQIMQRALDVLAKLKDKGKIRATGASIKGPNVTEATEELCRQYIKSGKIDTIQLVYSILRQRLSPVIDEAERSGIGIIARTTLESGLLTGRYAPGQRFKGRDQRSRYEAERLDMILRAVENLEQFAVRSPYASLDQVALRFALIPRGVSTIIVGMERAEDVARNAEVLELPPLEDSLVERLRTEYGQDTDRANYL
jgi:aryl-alcohol dehydrogenase-like predicted oxidoreductase